MDDIQNPVIYKKAVGNVVLVTMLFMYNSSSIIDGNQYLNHKEVCVSEINSIYKTFTTQAGISWGLPGYTHKEIIFPTKTIFMDNEKMSNIEKLEKIAKLESGWDGDCAKTFSREIIQKVKDIIMDLKVQPEIFPTMCNTIQVEYECEDGSYLEIEIPEKGKAKIFSIDCEGKESKTYVEANSQEINKVVKSFYGQKFS